MKGGFLSDPAAFIESMGELLETSLDPSTIGTYLPDAVGITRDHIYRAVIQYPLVHGAQNDPRGSVLIPRMNLISDLAARAFPAAGTMPVGLERSPSSRTTRRRPSCRSSSARHRRSRPTAPTAAPIPPAPTSEPTAPPPTSEPNPTPTPTDKPAKPTPEPTPEPTTAGP